MTRDKWQTSLVVELEEVIMLGRTICFPEFVQRLRGIPTASEDPYTKKLEVNVGFLGAAENISSHKLEL